MKKIKLTKGKYALIDRDDFEWLNQWKWSYDSSVGYAKRTEYISPKESKSIYMHRLINKTPDGIGTDHINQDKLDNRKDNLRMADKRLNGTNRGAEISNKSGHKNVYFDNRRSRWNVDVRFMDERKIKTFLTLEEAVVYANEAREEIYG